MEELRKFTSPYSYTIQYDTIQYNIIQYNKIAYLKTFTSGKVALTPEPRAHVENARLYKTNYNILYTIILYKFGE